MAFYQFFYCFYCHQISSSSILQQVILAKSEKTSKTTGHEKFFHDVLIIRSFSPHISLSFSPPSLSLYIYREREKEISEHILKTGFSILSFDGLTTLFAVILLRTIAQNYG